MFAHERSCREDDFLKELRDGLPYVMYSSTCVPSHVPVLVHIASVSPCCNLSAAYIPGCARVIGKTRDKESERGYNNDVSERASPLLRDSSLDSIASCFNWDCKSGIPILNTPAQLSEATPLLWALRVSRRFISRGSAQTQ